MPVNLNEIRELFFEESFDNLDRMESNLLELENGSVDDELINSIFRGAHSIKGGAGIFDFEHIISFSHIMETLLDGMRHGERIITQSVIDLLLRSVDALRMMVSALKGNSDYDVQEVQVCQDDLQGILKAPLEKAPVIQAASSTIEITTPHPNKENLSHAEEDFLPADKGWHIVFKPDLSMLKTGNDPINLFDELACLGKLTVKVDTSQVPAFHDLDVQACYLSWELILYADVERALIDEVFEWVEDECQLDISPLIPPTQPLGETVSLKQNGKEAVPAVDKNEKSVLSLEKDESALEKGKISSVKTEPPSKHTVLTHNVTHHATEANSIRVSIDKIDDLINMVGELVITQSMLEQIGNNFNSSLTEQLRDGLSQLERNSRELQESVMRIRMLPISFSFNRFPRLVHNLSLQLNKKVELKLSGEHTELDKTVLEKMSDPLVHLVRNALDHGIETPAMRQAVGKSEMGTLHLHAFHQGGNIIIQISDDGAGFDLEKIRAKAIGQGLLNQDDHPSEEQLYDFIFHPGFTTVAQVSDLSGRGVGMDVVRRNIRALGGTIEIQSKPGQGSTFRIRLPLTLAILDGQLVRVGQEIYILSLLSIIESLRVKPKLVNSYTGLAEVYRLRDEYIPILRLYDLFGITPNTTQLAQGILVIVEGENQKIGLFVDELLSQQQIVIKSLENNYKKIPGISAATILGDGSVALILDVAELIQLFHAKTKNQASHSTTFMDSLL